MNLLLILSCIIIIILSVYGHKAGFVKMLVPIVSGLFALFFIFLLKDWLFAFLFRWTIFQGEHILARVVVILLIYLLCVFGFKWVIGVLKLLTKLPVVHGLNKLFGLLLGLIEGFLLVWLLLYIIQIKEGSLFGVDFRTMIMGSPFLGFLSDHNLIAHLMNTLFGGWLC
ncbi:MAG: CvpA family protein [Lachnospiraceae bacterium]|nr:CvpA family protein [Lachnospiraceae bacterium]